MGSFPSNSSDASKGAKFLAKMDKKSDVHKLPSGLRFKILTPVPDAGSVLSPTESDKCFVHYHGTLINGKVFDSSVDRGQPATFAPGEVIDGWFEALQLMVEGEEWEVYLPPELAYGEKGSGKSIPPDATLIFTIQLIRVIRGGKPGSDARQILEEDTGLAYEDMYS